MREREREREKGERSEKKNKYNCFYAQRRTEKDNKKKDSTSFIRKHRKSLGKAHKAQGEATKAPLINDINIICDEFLNENINPQNEQCLGSPS